MSVISKRLVMLYLDNVKMYLEHSWMSEPKSVELYPTYPDEELMRAIEEEAGVPEQGADDFRRSIMAHLGSLCLSRKPWVWDFNLELVKAVNKLIKHESMSIFFEPDPLGLDPSELPLSKVGQ